jgi:hypothetical protein
MRRILQFLALAVIIPVAGATAQAPDFSGTWKINLIKSDQMPQRPGGQPADMSNLMLTVTQTAEAVTIVQSGMGPERTSTYFLDGRESTNPGMRGGDMKTTSKWDGAKLVTEGKATMEGQQGPMTMTWHEERMLSDDGKTMTVSTTTDTPMGKRTMKRVFEKQ